MFSFIMLLFSNSVDISPSVFNSNVATFLVVLLDTAFLSAKSCSIELPVFLLWNRLNSCSFNQEKNIRENKNQDVFNNVRAEKDPVLDK